MLRITPESLRGIQRFEYGRLCRHRELTQEYFESIASKHEIIEEIIKCVLCNDDDSNVRFDTIPNRNHFDLIQLISYLRRPGNSEYKDPFSSKGILERTNNAIVHFPLDEIQIVFPEIGDTHFIKFRFQDLEEMSSVMGNVENCGFSNFITATTSTANISQEL